MDDWKNIKHFGPGENWGDPRKMVPELIYELDRFREFTGKKTVIHRGYVPGKRQHGLGTAADLHVCGMSLFDQFLAATRFSFNGIGVYPLWNNPGLHLDVRRTRSRAMWGRLGSGDYRALDSEFIDSYVHDYHSVIYSPLSVTMPRKTKKDKTWYLNLNNYRNTHHRVLADAKIIHSDLMTPQIKLLPEMKNARFVFVFYPPSRRRYDLDNVCSIHAKFVIDTIVSLGKLTDDSQEIVKSIKFVPGGEIKGTVKILIGGDLMEEK